MSSLGGGGGGSSWLENKMKNIRTPTRSQSPSRQTSSRSSSPAPTLPPAAPLTRMPSSDALDRSTHNAVAKDDGSELTKNEIIAKLKKANAVLTDRTADMEATFMNQCNVLASAITDQTQDLNVKDVEIANMNAKIATMEDQLIQKDSMISKVEEEKVFQKQTIIDLKNQLFQLQNDVEDVRFDKSEELASQEKKSAKAGERIATLEADKMSLQIKADEALKERDECKTELIKVQEELEVSIEIKSLPQNTMADSPQRSLGEDSVTSAVRQNWKQLEGAQEKLQTSNTMLHETQSSLATLEHKHKATLKYVLELESQIHTVKSSRDKEVEQLKSKLDTKESSRQEIIDKFQTSVAKLQESKSALDSLEHKYQEALKQVEDLKMQVHGEKSTCDQQILELKSMLKSRDDSIYNLHGRLETFNEDLTKAEGEIDHLNSQIDNDEVRTLQADLSQTSDLLDKEKDLTVSLKDKYKILSEIVEKLQKETSELRGGSVEQILADKDEYITSLEQKVDVFRASVAETKKSSEMIMSLKMKRIHELEDKVKEKAQQSNNSEFAQMLKTQVKLLKDEKAELKTQFEEQLAIMESQIGTLRTRIEDELLKNAAMEESHYKEIEELNAVLEEEANEARQDLDSVGENWKTEKENLTEKIAILEAELSSLATMNRKLKEAYKEVEMIKNSDHLSEIADLRENLRRAKEVSGGADHTKPEKQSAAKRAYFFSIEKKHKKELVDLDTKRRKEVDALQSKLSDRDTTITATIKSSVSQEQEIMSLKSFIKSLEDKSPSRRTSRSLHANDSKMSELRNTISDLQATKSTMSIQIARLKMESSGTKSGGYNSPGGDLYNQLNDYKVKLHERDGAIATLVKSSITQEQHISALREEVAEARNRQKGHSSTFHNGGGPSWQEHSRLQQESEMFAGQIIELDEEIEDLRQHLAEQKPNTNQGSNLSYVVEELENQVQDQKQKILKESNKFECLRTELGEERELRMELEDDVKSLKSKLKKNSKLSRVEDELEEVEEANGKLQHEVREVRRKMRTAQLEAEKVPDLESEITSMRDSLNKMKIATVQRRTDEVLEIHTQGDLQRSLGERAKIEADLKTSQEQIVKLEDELLLHEDQEQALQRDISKIKLSFEEVEVALQDELEVERKRNTKLSNLKDTSELKFHRTVDMLKGKIKDLENDIDEQNEIISALTNEVKKLRSNNAHDSDANDIILALTNEVKKLRSKQLSDQGGESDVIQALSHEVKSLHEALKKKGDEVEARDIEATVRAEVEDELLSMKQQKEFLSNEVSKLQVALDSIGNDNQRIIELKKQVGEAEKGRTHFEKTMISTYERKLNLMQMNKDLTIDGLRKELSQCKKRQKELEADLLNKIRLLETEKREIEAELQAKMQHKNAKIQFLEQTLSAHEQVSGHMKEELDQLQSGMETVSVTRRAEVEEIQEDLMDAQAKTTKYERKITSLKMEVEELRLQHRNEVGRLQNTIMSLESDSETPMMRDVAMERERRLENDHRQQLKDLMTKVNMLQEENATLKHTSDKDVKPRASNNDKWRNSALQEQVIRLQQRLREFEGDSESVRSGSSRRSSRTESSRRIPRTPAQSYRKDSSSRSGGRDDISTHTEMTF